MKGVETISRETLPFMSSGPEATKLEPPGAENANTLEQGRTRCPIVSSVAYASDNTQIISNGRCRKVPEGFGDIDKKPQRHDWR